MAAPLASKYRRESLEREQRRAVRRALLAAAEQGVQVPLVAGGDKRQLRGLPAYARGVGGTMAGTQPERALISDEPRNGRPWAR